ncbi:nitronate monooxygenase [Massilia sp. W12]|uniref:NAD(P)H-dependent flavin oxidoreductase n=1 Tax=Massilia sp. W12 TaxID=3126507 RepID=UPI0030D5C94A
MSAHSTLPGAALPIIQAPMAGSQDSKLALAVAAAGGLGSIPCAMLSPAQIQAELAVLAASGQAFNVNFFCHQMPAPDQARLAAWQQALQPYYEEAGLAPASGGATRMPFDALALEALRAHPPAIVSFHFGLPAADLLAAVRALGCKVWACATTLAEGLWLQQQGVDAVIAQGVEAGGHRGMFLDMDLQTQLGTFALTRLLAQHLHVPVIAAGGIVDHAGVRAALALGAVAAQVGSAYLLTPQANTSATHRAALHSAAAQETALTTLFSGRPARGIVNRLMRELGPLNPLAPAFPLASAALAPLRAHAEKAGRGDFSPLWAGQAASLCRDMDAGDLTRMLAGV